MAVSCRFRINRVSEMGWGTEIEMVPDYADGRNKDWAAATPAGMMRLTVTNENAIAQLEQGAPVHITIEPQDA